MPVPAIWLTGLISMTKMNKYHQNLIKFRKLLRWAANKWSDKKERKAAFREKRYLLRQKKKHWMVDTNSNLRTKQSKISKRYWALFKKLDQKTKEYVLKLQKCIITLKVSIFRMSALKYVIQINM